MISVKDKLYDIDLIIEDIKYQPQTYSTILREEVCNTTCQFKLRTKINKLCKQGVILKAIVPGTRFGQVLLYVEDRKYKIIVEADRIGVNVYYFFEYEKVGKFYLKIKDCWKLNDTEWIKQDKEIILFEGKILKFF